MCSTVFKGFHRRFPPTPPPCPISFSVCKFLQCESIKNPVNLEFHCVCHFIGLRDFVLDKKNGNSLLLFLGLYHANNNASMSEKEKVIAGNLIVL